MSFIRPLLWAGLLWAGLLWAALGWAGLGWAGLGWAGLGWAGLGWQKRTGRHSAVAIRASLMSAHAMEEP